MSSKIAAIILQATFSPTSKTTTINQIRQYKINTRLDIRLNINVPLYMFHTEMEPTTNFGYGGLGRVGELSSIN